jgi:transcriptional regulator with XRE-family HTH domain
VADDVGQEKVARGGRAVVLLRQEIGDVLRDARTRQGRTLREVSTQARVSLGYLSEVERGQKEASSELLASICGALDVPLSSVFHQVSERFRLSEALELPGGLDLSTELDVEHVTVPDTVPEDLSKDVGIDNGLVAIA